MTGRRPIIALWDIDGTLVSGRGAGRRALELAFDRLHGRPDAFEGVRFAGNTDRAIVRQALAAIGAPTDEAAIDDGLAAYVAALAAVDAMFDAYTAHAGVAEALASLDGREGVALGLGTGNIEAGGRLKLRAADLNRYFGFGGFGSDAEDRAELLEIGARRGAAALGVARADCAVVVIGDTELDVAAAHAIGATAVAVATGGSPIEQLRETGAAYVVPTLDAPEAGAALRALFT